MADICAVLNLHSEGITAHSSFLSILRCKLLAEAADISVEILVVADCPDGTTEKYLQTAREYGARTLITDVDDLGLARNIAVTTSSSRFIAFLDGDDLWSPRWLTASYAAATSDDRSIVWHPEANFYFGKDIIPYWLLHPDMDDSPDGWYNLGLRNLWTSLSFAACEIFAATPYRKSNLNAGLGYEDWTWNCEVIADGSIHKIVPGVAHLIRRSRTSLSIRSSALNILPNTTNLFQNKLNLGSPEPPRGGITKTI